MIEDIADKISAAQRKKPYMFIVVFAVITMLLIPGIFNLVGNIEPSLEKVLPQEIDEIKVMNDMRSEFGADMIYILIYPELPATDVCAPLVLNYMDMLSSKISTEENVITTETLSDVVKKGNDGILPDSITQARYIISNDQGANRYKNSADSLAVMYIRTDTGANSKEIAKLLDQMELDIESLEEYNPGLRTEITGFGAIDKATFEIIMQDFGNITIFSMLFIMIIVFFTFKSIVKGILPMIIVIISLLWTLGVVGYLGMTITVVTMVAAAMIMGLGIDFGIHLVHSYFEKRKNNDRNKTHKDTINELLRAMIGASLTTTAGFLALLFGVLPAMKNLGIILSLGIMFTLIGGVLLLPVIIYLYDGKNTKKTRNGGAKVIIS